jgi:hypothetical protein
VLLRPVLTQRPASDISSGDGAADIEPNGKAKAIEYKKGPYDKNEIAIMEAAFEQARHILNFNHEQMQVEIKNWGKTKPSAPYKIVLKEALPHRNLDSIREFCQRHFNSSRHQKGPSDSTKALPKVSGPLPVTKKDSIPSDSTGALPKVSGPFSVTEKETIKRTFNETLQAQSLSRAEFLGAVFTWEGPVVEGLLAALAAALPRRNARSLSDYIKRTYVHERKVPLHGVVTHKAAQAPTRKRVSSKKVSVLSAEHILDSDSDSETHTMGKPLLAVVIPVEEATSERMTKRVACDSTSPDETDFVGHSKEQTSYEIQDSNDLALSHDSLPADVHTAPNTAKSHLQGRRAVLQQPTPVTSSANVSGPESEPYPGEPRGFEKLPETPQFAAEDHLNIFDLGDYYDILKENVVVLSKNAALSELVDDNTDLGVGNDRFWQAISDAMLRSKLISIGNPTSITQLRRLAYRTAVQNFSLDPAARALQRDGQRHPLEKMQSLLDSILNGPPAAAKQLPRMWRHDLIDCTREQIAWILYSEELEKAKLCNKARGESDQSISNLGRKARKRLRRAWSRVQAEMEKAKILAGEGRAQAINATARVVSDPPPEVQPLRPDSPTLLDVSQAYTSDADDGPVQFRAADAISRRNFSMNDEELDDDIDVIPAGKRSAAGGSNDTSRQHTEKSNSNTHRPHVSSHQRRAPQSQISAREVVIPNSQPDESETVTATKSKKRPRDESPASTTSADHVANNTAAAKLKARHIAKKAKVQLASTLPSSYLHPIPIKAVKQNLSKAPAVQRRAYGDMSRKTFMEKCRAGGN